MSYLINSKDFYLRKSFLGVGSGGVGKKTSYVLSFFVFQNIEVLFI